MRLWTATAATALLAAAMWLAWLGWDHEYYLADGAWQGPYRAWQVVGCALSIAAATVAAHLWAKDRRTLVMLPVAAPIGIAVPLGVVGGSSDETGMWLAGVLFIVMGGYAGLRLLLGVVDLARRAPMSPEKTMDLYLALALVIFAVYPLVALVPLAAAAWVYVTRWRPSRRPGSPR